MKSLLEVVCTSVDDCRRAEESGAHRIELVSAIELGGVTPSRALVEEAMAATSIPIMVMVRPRSGGFVYSQEEAKVMKQDVAEFNRLRVAGVVFGALTPLGDVDREMLADIVEAAGDTQIVCHRCFDATRDPRGAMEDLITLGFDRILTSGQKKTALEGAALIKLLIEGSAGRIELLPGGGVRSDNAAEILRLTGANQIHAGLFMDVRDQTPAATVVDYGAYKRLDTLELQKMLDAIG